MMYDGRTLEEELDRIKDYFANVSDDEFRSTVLENRVYLKEKNTVSYAGKSMNQYLLGCGDVERMEFQCNKSNMEAA